MTNLALGFLLMAVGMISVFVILLIVIYGSQGIISIINSIAPAPAPEAAKAQQDPAIEAVLSACVQTLTAGKGRMTNFKKI